MWQFQLSLKQILQVHSWRFTWSKCIHGGFLRCIHGGKMAFGREATTTTFHIYHRGPPPPSSPARPPRRPPSPRKKIFYLFSKSEISWQHFSTISKREKSVSALFCTHFQREKKISRWSRFNLQSNRCTSVFLGVHSWRFLEVHSWRRNGLLKRGQYFSPERATTSRSERLLFSTTCHGASDRRPGQRSTAVQHGFKKKKE